MDTAKAVLRGKFIVLNEYIGRNEKYQISNVSFHLNTLIIEEKNKKPEQAEDRKQ